MSFWQDIRYAFRTLKKSPGFTIVVVLALAVGIGANTAIYSLVDAVFLRGLPYQDADRLVVLIGNVERATGVERRGGSYPDFLDWRAQATTFVDMAAYIQTTTTFVGTEESERIPIEAVGAWTSRCSASPRRPAGRFGPTRIKWPVVTPSSSSATACGSGALAPIPAIVGRKVQIGTRPYEIIGVVPAGFRGVSDQAEAWLPFVMAGGGLTSRGSRGLQVLARLKAGATMAQAEGELDAIAKRLEKAHPDTNEKRGIEVSELSVKRSVRSRLR